MLFIILGFALGLILGSFANVIIYRLPCKMSIVTPPSTCRNCNTKILFYDLLPVVSWILLKGRCRSCREKISPRYPLIEFTCGLLFAGMVFFIPSLSAIFLSLFAFILLSVGIIDWDTGEIPDGLLIAATIIGVVWIVCGYISPLFSHAPGFNDAGLGILAGGLPLLVVDKLTIVLVKKDGFGYGDVKLMAVAGLFIGWQLVFIAFFIAFISGGIAATVLLITGRAKRGEYIAFGPFLCCGVITAIWFGQDILGCFFW